MKNCNENYNYYFYCWFKFHIISLFYFCLVVRSIPKLFIYFYLHICDDDDDVNHNAVYFYNLLDHFFAFIILVCFNFLHVVILLGININKNLFVFIFLSEFGSAFHAFINTFIHFKKISR